jgi:hypothetical protein
MKVVFSARAYDPPHLLWDGIYLLINDLYRHSLLFLHLLLLALFGVAAGSEVLHHVPSNLWPGML